MDIKMFVSGPLAQIIEHWEMIATLVGGVLAAWGLVAWPRPVLACIGLLSLLLGLLSLVLLNTVTVSALLAVLGGVGLIGFGALVGSIEALLTETRLRSVAAQGSTVVDSVGLAGAHVASEPSRAESRVEPRLWAESVTKSGDGIRVSPAGSG